MPRLVVIEGNMEGRSFDISGGMIFLGRSSDNDIQLPDMSISRKHLKIFKIGERYFIEDLKSRNGTLINGMRAVPGEGFQVVEYDTVTLGYISVRLVDLPKTQLLERELPVLRRSEIEAMENPASSNGDRRAKTARELELINRVSRLLRQSFNMRGFLERVLEYILHVLPRIDTAAIVLIDYQKDGKGRLRRIFVRVRDSLQSQDPALSQQVIDKVIEAGESIRMSDTSYESKRLLAEEVYTIKVGSVMCVPLVSNSVVRGALYVDSIKGPYGFRKEDLLLLSSLSGFLALVIEKTLLSATLRSSLRSPPR